MAASFIPSFSHSLPMMTYSVARRLRNFSCFFFSPHPLLDHLPQPLVFGLQFIHLIQFLADEALGKRMLDVVTAVDGKEEIIQSGLHIALLKCLYGIVVLTVCLALRQRRVVNKSAHQVKIDGKDIELSFKEFELLAYFMENQGIALSREKILNNVWNYDYFGDARTIDTHVKKLRSKLGEKGELIKTIWGMGYKFEP